MTWDDAKAALQLLSEERVGIRVRQAEAAETARLERSAAILRAEEKRRGPR
jgi:hypothetical protein